MRKTPLLLIMLLMFSVLIPFTQITTAAAPTTTTQDATGVEETNATLQGTLVDDGGIGTNLYESYNTSNHARSSDNLKWLSQGFTPTISHYIQKVILRLYNQGSPGKITVKIYETAGGLPTGTYLTFGTTDGNTLPLSGYEWRNITLNTYFLTAGTTYAIVVNGTTTGDFWWRYHDSGTYAGGRAGDSSDAGGTWGLLFVNYDFTFKEYGSLINVSIPDVFFQYGLTTSYGTTTANQSKINGDTFNQNIKGLIPGQLYHFRAAATNSVGTSYGADKTFLTKPQGPTNLQAQSNTSTMNYITWTKGTGANNTRIQQKTTGYPTGIADGVNIYNGTATNKEDTPLTPGQLYYYKIFNIAIWGTLSKWADTNTTAYCLTRPGEPTTTTITLLNSTTRNLTWIKGTNSNNTVIVINNLNDPTSITDGIIIYNGTGTYVHSSYSPGTTYYYRGWGFTNFTTPSISRYSINGSPFINTTGMLFSVFNETNPSQALYNWSIEIKNLNGTEVYFDSDNNNILALNASLMPQGEVTTRISKTGYRERVVYTTIQTGIIYSAYFYLPSLTNPSTSPNASTDCIQRTYTDSKSITTGTQDAWIPLAYPRESIIAVQLWNTTLYTTYGGWVYVPSDKYTYITGNQTIRINKTLFNTHALTITIGKIDYYYQDCPTSGHEPPQLYYAQVVETIQIGDTTSFQPIENALITFKRYINTTDNYEILSALKTDAYGKVNLWLFPSQIYLVSITCPGYNDGLSDFIPAPANSYGQTDLKVFRITRQTGGSNMPVYDTLFTNITYTLEPTSTRHTTGFTLYYNITSHDNRLEWYKLIVYRQPTGSTTWTLLYNGNQSNPAGGSLSYTITNISGRYSVECWFKKTGYPAYEIYHTGSIVYFIVLLKTTAALIPDEAYFIITIVLMLVGMGACALYFTTGPITGYVGLGIMAFMLYLHNDIQVNAGFQIAGVEQYISGWVIFGITFLIYTAALFLWSRL